MIKAGKYIDHINRCPSSTEQCKHPALTKGGKQNDSTRTKIEKKNISKCDRKCLLQYNDPHILTVRYEGPFITGRRRGSYFPEGSTQYIWIKKK